MKLKGLGRTGKALLVIPLILLLGLVMLDPKREGDTHYATMSDLLVQETNKGTRTQIMATLESGITRPKAICRPWTEIGADAMVWDLTVATGQT